MAEHSEGERAPGEITLELRAARAGDEQALRRFFALIHDDLRRLAARHVRSAQAPHGATSLVHEVFLRLARKGELPFEDRGHFFAVASLAMRQIVIDRARSNLAARRGAGAVVELLDEGLQAAPASEAAPEQLLALADALARLAQDQPRLAEAVEWHFFGGLTFGEIAEARGVSERTVLRDWRSARALLHTWLE